MKKITLLAALSLSLSVHASTVSQYETVVRWVDGKGITQFQGKCPASFGVVGVSGPVFYDLRCPSFKEANIIVYLHTNLASINGSLPARVSYPVKDTISLFTAEGETLTFVLPDCKKDAC